jgi:hydrogenase maturation protease
VNRTLVACVGNILRRDDGFGVAVADALRDKLPAGVDLIETGIGGMAIIHQLMDGYETLVVVDAIECGASPGTVVVLEPSIEDPQHIEIDDWRERFSNLHLAEPGRVLLLARALGVLPRRVLLIGCQPQECDDLVEGLSAPVMAAVGVAAAKVRELI